MTPGVKALTMEMLVDTMVARASGLEAVGRQA